MRAVIDVETNGLVNPTKVHCVVVKDIDTGVVYSFTESKGYDDLKALARTFSKVIGHNFLSFDAVCLERICGISIAKSIILDTLILSQLFHYQLDGGHSLEAWGERLKHPKVGLGITDWSTFTPDMLVRCRNDVELNEKVYRFLQSKLDRPEFYSAIRVEHEIAQVCMDMHDNGFKFDIDRARALHSELSIEVDKLHDEFTKAFPPKTVEVQLKTKVRTDVIPFNPASPTQIVERLSPYWHPTDRTDSGKSWKINENNLSTLDSNAPDAARSLVKYLLLVSRLRTLKQWFDSYNEYTGRIHGDFRGLGTWTHRFSHRSPNMGNIAAEKSIKYKTPELKQLATDLGGRMRSLWCCPDDSWLVGTDAEGIQLRIFAHYIDDPAFTQSVISGKKEDGTDPHSLNARLLKCTRDNAKTFIYAFLLGAGEGKLGDILGLDRAEGSKAKLRFIEAYPGLAKLRNEGIPRDAKRGYFQGFDGRLVRCDSEHLMLAGYLQNGEACIMKHANVLWRKEFDRRNIPYKQCNFVHDEWQTEFRGPREIAEVGGQVQARSIADIGVVFGLRCPMAGQYSIGKNWLETH